MRSAAALSLIAPVLSGVLLLGCGREGASASAPTASAARMGPLEEHTNRQGRDLSQQRVATASQCAALCADHAQCRAMSFAKGDGETGGVCLLKSDVPAASENPAVTSAVKTASAP